MKISLTSKLVLYFLSLSILPLSIVGYALYENGKEAIERQTFSYLDTATQMQEGELDLWLGKNIDALRLLTFSPILEKNAPILATSRIKADPVYMRAYEEVKDLFSGTVESQPGIDGISLIGRDGVVLLSTSENEEGRNISNYPYFIWGLKEAYVQNIFIPREGSSPTMVIASPLADSNGVTLGVIAADLDLQMLDELTRKKTLIGETGVIYLVNKYHYLISEPKFKSGRPLTSEIHSYGIDNCLKGNSGQSIYENHQGISVLGSFRWLPERELCILAEMATDEAFAPANSLKENLIKMGVFLTIALLALIPVLTSTITKPIMELVEGVKEVGKGNLRYRFNVKSKDEIGELAAAFNSMVKSLEESQRQLVQSEKLASLGQLAAGVAHEINNPLTNISNNAQMLMREVNGKYAKRLEVIEENVQRASRIVRNLLDFSRAPEFHPEYIDVNLLLDRSLELTKHELKKVKVVKDYDKQLPEILADPIQLQQVFVNIITNACQAMPNGGTLTLVTRFYRNIVEIRIADTGVGIRKEDLSRIFDPFFTTRKVGRGTGLGLSISYKIVDAHKGKIEVESEVNKGTIFIIKLPAEG
jgi:signal transduction histidine kinase